MVGVKCKCANNKLAYSPGGNNRNGAGERSFVMYDRYVGIELSKVNNIIKRECGTNAEDDLKNDITGKNGWIIGYIAENKDRDIYQRDIERDFVIRRSTVSGILGLMEKKGYIVREGVAHDARLKKLTLTDKAWEYLSKTMKMVDMQEERMRRGLSQEELDNFFATLDKVKQNLENEND